MVRLILTAFFVLASTSIAAAQDPAAKDPATQGLGQPVSKQAAAKPLERTVKGGVMGTEYRLAAIGTDAVKLDAALAAAVKELQRVEDLMTDWRASPLSTLNDNAGKGPQVLPLELAAMIGRGQAVGELTDGAFDISFAGVGKLWDFKRKPPRVPTAEQVKAALAHVDYRRIEIVPAKLTVALPAGFRIGLGGIAKGYGIDAAMKVLMQHDIRNAVVNVGGDMSILGKKQGKPWPIGIAHPRHKEHALAELKLSNVCVVTSGDYERFFEVDGVRYHHILDPRTGYPSKGCITATVVASHAEYADALATALCVLGPEKGLALIESLPRVEAIVVGLDGKAAASKGLRSSLVVPADSGKKK
ncbi:MAG: thiamine biosynthesis lipoprotein [Neolewinella sp.]|jgi:thiamine biosynthesis lipoprotein